MSKMRNWASLETNELRKLGYSIYSTFEEELRDYISEICKIECGDIWIDDLPQGVLSSINEKLKKEDINIESIEKIRDLLEYSDFPHLKEILLSKKYKKYIEDFSGTANQGVFIKNMDEIYGLRIKVAHVKRHFSFYNLTRLVSYTEEVSRGKSGKKFSLKLDQIKKSENADEYSIPDGFIITNIENCPDNLPSQDYEFDGGFIGRKDQINKIKQMLYSDLDRVITLSGAGGVGKTALALVTSYNILADDKNPFDGIVWISAKKVKLTPSGIEPTDILPVKSYEFMLNKIIETLTPEIYDSLIKYLSESFKSSEKKVLDNELYVKQLLEKDKYLIIVDNLETITDDRIINFIKDIPQPHKVLITSRRGLGEIERRFEIKELHENEAVLLFRVVSREKNLDSLMRAKDDVIKKYVNRVQRYPLAIKWCLGLIAIGKNVQEVYSNFDDPKSDLVKFCFEDIFSRLTNDAKKILYGISIFEKPPSKSLLMHVVGIDADSFEDEMRTLVLSSMAIIDQVEIGGELISKYSTLDLTKQFIDNKLDSDKDLKYSLYGKKEEIESLTSEVEKAKVVYESSFNDKEPTNEKESIALIKCQSSWNFAQSGNYNDAKREMEDAIKTAPGYVTVYRYYADIESDFRHIERANDLMDIATKIDPNNDFLWFTWSNINRKYKRNIEAIKYIKESLKIKKKSPYYLNAFGYLLKEMGQYKESCKAYADALENTDKPNDKIMIVLGLSESLRMWSKQLFDSKKYKYGIDKINESERYLKIGLTMDENDFDLNTLYKHILFEKGRMLTLRKGINHGKKSFLECLEHTLHIDEGKFREIKGNVYYHLIKYLYDEKSENSHFVNECLTYANDGMDVLMVDSSEYNYIRKMKSIIVKHLRYLALIRLKSKGVVTFFDQEKHYGFIESDHTRYFFRLKNFDVFVNESFGNNMVGKTVYFEIKQQFDPSKSNNAVKIIPGRI